MASEVVEPRSYSWGAFPADQYLLSGTVISERGTAGLDETQLQSIPDEDQINEILKPWRSEKLRNIAGALKNHRSDAVVVLRTHYGGDLAEQELMQKIMLENEDCDPNYKEEGAWWQFLDDPGVFDFADHWEQVFEILPELTLRGLGLQSLLSSDRFVEAVSFERKYGKDPLETVQQWARLSAHPLAIADRETFTTSKLLLLFIGSNGNVVRSARVDVSELGIYRMTSFRGAVGDWCLWQEAKVGERYQPDGDIGQLLRQKVEEARAAVPVSEESQAPP